MDDRAVDNFGHNILPAHGRGQRETAQLSPAQSSTGTIATESPARFLRISDPYAVSSAPSFSPSSKKNSACLTHLIVGVNELSPKAHVEHRLVQAVQHYLRHLRSCIPKTPKRHKTCVVPYAEQSFVKYIHTRNILSLCRYCGLPEEQRNCTAERACGAAKRKQYL